MSYDDWKTTNPDDIDEPEKVACPACEGQGGERESDGWHTCTTCLGLRWIWEHPKRRRMGR